MRVFDIIKKKRDGGELCREEIDYFIKGTVSGEIPDYQITAFLMAVYFRGMTPPETALFTLAVADSGDRLDLSVFGKLSADKHSTGGVGDKTTLIAAPIAAALGCKVAKLSGRGLGHTGGTVDKLESIPGYMTSMPLDRFFSQVEKTGIAVMGQTGSVATADKTLYSLRDVTATVDCIPLIASSIMGKKLAAGAHNIVLDVKCGSGAFMKDAKSAAELARAMVEIGGRCGRRCAALITDMDFPLGRSIGNSLEVAEALEVLKGGGESDLREISIELAATMAALAESESNENAAKILDSVRKRAADAVDSGKALSKFGEWIAAQGGDISFIDNPSLLGKSRYSYDVLSPEDGYVFAMDSEEIGICSVMLGAGREKKGDAISYTAGITLNAKPGQRVKSGDVLCTMYSDSGSFIEPEKRFLSAVSIYGKEPEKKPLIIDTVI